MRNIHCKKTPKPLCHPLKPSLLLTLALGISLTACNSNGAETKKNVGGTGATTAAAATTATATAVPIDASSNNDVVSALQSNLKASGIEQTVISAVPTSMPDIYWVTAEGMPAFFTDKQGKHIIQGQIIGLGDAKPVDITANLMAAAAKTKLAQVPKEEMIIFPATGATKAAVYAFTDADCGYCRKLHSEISAINAEGIEVRYLAWPRSEQSQPIMQSIWCSSDRKAALTAAKAGQNISAPPCPNPVAKQLELGLSLGVRGTPAIFTESGQQIGGYLPAHELAKAALAN